MTGKGGQPPVLQFALKSCPDHRWLSIRVSPDMTEGDMSIISDTLNCRRCWVINPLSRVRLLRLGGNSWPRVIVCVGAVMLGGAMTVYVPEGKER